MLLKDISFAHHVCVYLVKSTVKQLYYEIILQYTVKQKKYCFLLYLLFYILNNIIYLIPNYCIHHSCLNLSLFPLQPCSWQWPYGIRRAVGISSASEVCTTSQRSTRAGRTSGRTSSTTTRREEESRTRYSINTGQPGGGIDILSVKLRSGEWPPSASTLQWHPLKWFS